MCVVITEQTLKISIFTEQTLNFSDSTVIFNISLGSCFILSSSVSAFLSHLSVCCRSVAEQERPFALGMQFVLLRTLGE